VKTFPTILLLLLTTMLAACTTSNSRQKLVQDPSDLLFDNFFRSGGDEPAALQAQQLVDFIRQLFPQRADRQA
jgi:hypothetical protein